MTIDCGKHIRVTQMAQRTHLGRIGTNGTEEGTGVVQADLGIGETTREVDGGTVGLQSVVPTLMDHVTARTITVDRTDEIENEIAINPQVIMGQRSLKNR